MRQPEQQAARRADQPAPPADQNEANQRFFGQVGKFIGFNAPTSFDKPMSREVSMDLQNRIQSKNVMVYTNLFPGTETPREIMLIPQGTQAGLRITPQQGQPPIVDVVSIGDNPNRLPTGGLRIRGNIYAQYGIDQKSAVGNSSDGELIAQHQEAILTRLAGRPVTVERIQAPQLQPVNTPVTGTPERTPPADTTRSTEQPRVLASEPVKAPGNGVNAGGASSATKGVDGTTANGAGAGTVQKEDSTTARSKTQESPGILGQFLKAATELYKKNAQPGSAAQPRTAPVEQPAKPAGQPKDRPASRSIEQPATQPAAKPATQPPIQSQNDSETLTQAFETARQSLKVEQPSSAARPAGSSATRTKDQSTARGIDRPASPVESKKIGDDHIRATANGAKVSVNAEGFITEVERTDGSRLTDFKYGVFESGGDKKVLFGFTERATDGKIYSWERLNTWAENGTKRFRSPCRNKRTIVQAHKSALC